MMGYSDCNDNFTFDMFIMNWFITENGYYYYTVDRYQCKHTYHVAYASTTNGWSNSCSINSNCSPVTDMADFSSAAPPAAVDMCKLDRIVVVLAAALLVVGIIARWRKMVESMPTATLVNALHIDDDKDNNAVSVVNTAIKTFIAICIYVLSFSNNEIYIVVAWISVVNPFALYSRQFSFWKNRT